MWTQDTYTKTKPKGGPGLGKKTYCKTIVGDLGQQLQLGLVDMTEDRKYSNNGYCWILTSKEVSPCYAFTEPSETKGGVDVANAMEKILSKFKVRFKKIKERLDLEIKGRFYEQELSLV